MGDFGVSPLLSQNVGESSRCGSFTISAEALALTVITMQGQIKQLPVLVNDLWLSVLLL